MKYTGQISTGQYEFMAFELESDDPQEAVDAYNSLKKASQTGDGLPNREWCRIVDNFVSTGSLGIDSEKWVEMSKYQQEFLAELKRCFSRMNKTI